MFREVTGLGVVQDIVEWSDYRRIANMIVQGSKRLRRRRSRIISRVDNDGDDRPKDAGKGERQKAKRSCNTSVWASIWAFDLFSPIQKVWQQLYAGYHNEGWKCNPIKGPHNK